MKDVFNIRSNSTGQRRLSHVAELSELVTASMIAKETGLGYHTILARIHALKVPTIQLGKFITIRRSDAARVSHPLYKGAKN